MDVIRLYSLFALEMIMKAAFGFDTDLQTNPDQDFVEKARNVFRTPLWIRAFSLLPFWTYLSRFVNILPNADYFIGLARNMLDTRSKQGSSGKKDLVQLMLEAHETTVDGVSKLSDNEIMAESITLLAGFETTGRPCAKYRVLGSSRLRGPTPDLFCGLYPSGSAAVKKRPSTKASGSPRELM